MTPKRCEECVKTHNNSVMLLCFPKRANIDFAACVDKCKAEAGLHSVQRLGDLPHSFEIRYIVSPRAATEAPLCGVPRKHTPAVEGAIAF